MIAPSLFWAFTDSPSATAGQAQVFATLPPDTLATGNPAPVQITTQWDNIGSGTISSASSLAIKSFHGKAGIDPVPGLMATSSDNATWAPFTELSQFLTGYNVVWSDFFPSLSLRTGGYWISTSAGYNASSAKGTWSPCCQFYMNSPQGFTDFGWGFFVNPAYNWQAIDPTFPPLGLIDITSNGMVLMASSGYPAIRASLPLLNGQVPFLSANVGTAQSMKIMTPYARRYTWYTSSGPWDFPGLWGLGDHYNGANPAIYLHYEIDDFQRYGTQFSADTNSAGTHIDTSSGFTGFGGGNYHTGASLLTNQTSSPHQTVTIHQQDFIYIFTDGIMMYKIPTPVGSLTYDLHHSEANMVAGPSFLSYPNTPLQSPALTIRSIEILAPSSNISGIFPPTPPVPALAWSSNFSSGFVPHGTSSGTVVATLTGASTYSVLGSAGLAVSGTNVIVSSVISSGTFNFYIRGLDANGVPGIAPKLTLTAT